MTEQNQRSATDTRIPGRGKITWRVVDAAAGRKNTRPGTGRRKPEVKEKRKRMMRHMQLLKPVCIDSVFFLAISLITFKINKKS